MLWNGKSNVIEDLEEKINEKNYIIPTESAQEKSLQHGTKNELMSSLKLAKDHMFCLIALSSKMKR
jgi:hypothetical protein